MTDQDLIAAFVDAVARHDAGDADDAAIELVARFRKARRCGLRDDTVSHGTRNFTVTIAADDVVASEFDGGGDIERYRFANRCTITTMPATGVFAVDFDDTGW
jgi:hypothetical protein